MTIPSALQVIDHYNSGTGTDLYIDKREFMSSVAPFAKPSQFKIVRDFFEKAATLPTNAVYTFETLAAALNIDLSKLGPNPKDLSLNQSDWSSNGGLSYYERQLAYQVLVTVC